MEFQIFRMGETKQACSEDGVDLQMAVRTLYVVTYGDQDLRVTTFSLCDTAKDKEIGEP